MYSTQEDSALMCNIAFYDFAPFYYLLHSLSITVN